MKYALLPNVMRIRKQARTECFTYISCLVFMQARERCRPGEVLCSTRIYANVTENLKFLGDLGLPHALKKICSISQEQTPSEAPLLPCAASHLQPPLLQKTNYHREPCKDFFATKFCHISSYVSKVFHVQQSLFYSRCCVALTMLFPRAENSAIWGAL